MNIYEALKLAKEGKTVYRPTWIKEQHEVTVIQIDEIPLLCVFSFKSPKSWLKLPWQLELQDAMNNDWEIYPEYLLPKVFRC